MTGMFSGHPLLFCENGNDLIKDFTAIPHLGDATGKGGLLVIKPNALSYCSFITSDCDNVELAMKFLDFGFKDDSISAIRHGEKGVDWNYEAGENAMGRTSYVNVVNSNAFSGGNSTWCANGHGIMTEENYEAVSVAADPWTEELYRMYKSYYAVMDTDELPAQTMGDLVYLEDEQEVVSEVAQPLRDYIASSRAEFATGVLDPKDDAAWEEYLKNMESLGNEEYMEVAQTAYTRMYGE